MTHYRMVHAGWGDRIEMTVQDFLQLSKDLPDYNINPKNFSTNSNGDITYDFGEISVDLEPTGVIVVGELIK